MANLNLLERLSKREPHNFTAETISISDVFQTTEKFFDEHFRGAVDIQNEAETERFISASPIGIAYFYRTLLEHIFGEGVLYVKAQTNNSQFIMHNEFSIKRNLDEKTEARLKTVARLSGFDIYFTSMGEKTCIDIVFAMRASKAIPIYAREKRTLYIAYVDVFFY